MTFDGNEFNVLVSDFLKDQGPTANAQSAHPDLGGGHVLAINDSSSIMWTYYRCSPGWTIDLNFALADGSGHTVRRVEQEDSRMNKIPYNQVESNFPTRFIPLPDKDYTF